MPERREAASVIMLTGAVVPSLSSLSGNRDYSRVGFFTHNEFMIISDEQERTEIPNYVAFPEHTGPPVVGRLIGRNSSDPEVQRAIKDLPYTLLDEYEQPVIRVRIKNDFTAYLPEEFTGMILEKLKQRNATSNAAALAKLNVLRLTDEPTAIAFAYGLGTTYCDGKGENVDCRYIVYEDDRRATHLTLLKSGKGGFGILGTVSDDREQESTSLFWESLLEQVPLNTPEQPTSGSSSNQTLQLVNRLLVDPALTSHVETLPETYFLGRKTVKPFEEFTPDQAIVCGASIQGYKIDPGDQDNMLDVVLLSLGVETRNRSFLRVIHRDTLSPTRKSDVVYMNVGDRRSLVIPIYEGERELASRNHRSGDITIGLDELSEDVKEEGKVKIELFFQFSPDEILTVWDLRILMDGGTDTVAEVEAEKSGG
ncbi:hypothetical protein BKA61DRAFT_733019 [Leptodontidium sp. MPI-SDFR-AT-0119]|nr:hypothetical protein BKA61DRAFT_733019 [Leptodontidium sp. MPI-SDFR-AT-0119]